MYSIIKSPTPDFLDYQSENYDDCKVFTNGHFYLYDRKTAYLIGRLDLHEKGSERTISWLLWTSVEALKFIEFSENPNKYGGAISAKLYSPLLFFDSTQSLDVILDFTSRDENYHPRISIPQDSTHNELRMDFMNGVDTEKFNSWIKLINE